VREKIIPHPPTLLLLAALLLASCIGLPADEIELTSEAVRATDQLVLATYEALSTALAATEEAAPTATARPTATATATPTIEPTPEFINLHVQITDGRQPLEGLIYLYWPENYQQYETPLTTEAILPLLPGEPVELIVYAEGYRDWTQPITPTRSLKLVVRMIEEP